MFAANSFFSLSILFLVHLVIGFIPRSGAVCKTPFIDILISPIFENGVTNKIELLWNIEDFTPGLMLFLINSNTGQCEFEYNVPRSVGDINTNISYTASPNVTYGFQKQTLEYYVELRSNDSATPLASSAMETNPTWMMDNKDKFSSLRICDLFIPGTHDSGAFTDEDNFGESRVQKYVMTQDEKIRNQLIFGIRSLDLRVGYYSMNANDSTKLYLNHGIQRISLFSTIVADIKEFMENTREIVILDIHQFPMGFTNNLQSVKPHEVLVSYLREELEEFMAPTNLTWSATLQEFWDVGRLLIVAYNDKDTQAAYSNILWSPVNQRWANAQDINALKTYMETEMQSPPFAPWSAMVELTATTTSVITDDMKGLRQMAYSVNKQVTQWFLQDEWGSEANIVACDFFRETSVVKTAILWNTRKASNSMCDKTDK